MMKPGKIRPLSPIMERHTPQHPLPEEIKKLPSDETVCQFCGVSYLIHHEIKKLEEKIASLEEELEDCHAAVEREKKLREELEKSKSAIKRLNEIVQEKESIIEKIAREIEEEKSLNEKLSLEVITEKHKATKILGNFRSYKGKVQQTLKSFHNTTLSMKSEMDELRCSVEQSYKENISFLANATNGFQHFIEASRKDFIEAKVQQTELQQSLDSATAASQHWKERANKYDKELSTLKHDLLAMHGSQSNKEQQLQQTIHALENSNKELTSLNTNREIQFKSLQADNALLDEKLRKKQTELQSAVVKLQKTEENANLTIQRLHQDCKELERELFSSQEEVRKMRAAHKEREKMERELSQQASLSSCQIEQVTAALSEAKAANQALIEERALMVTSHQNQIQQLRESFKRKLEECDGSTKAQRDLEMAEEKYKEASFLLEKKLREEFQIEMSVEKDKTLEEFSNMRAKHRKELRELDSELEKEVGQYKTRSETLNKKLELLQADMQQKQADCEAEKSSLKMIVVELEERIAQLTNEHEGNAALKKLEKVSVNQKLQETVKQNEELEHHIMSMKEEIGLLQDTVRRECEERFELTEALSQARDELKAYKAPSSSASSIQSAMSPVSALNKLNPVGIEADGGARLSGRTLRSLEMDSNSTRQSGQMASLRSLPDLHNRKDLSSTTTPSPPYETNNVFTNVKDISFGGTDPVLRRSNANGYGNGHIATKNVFNGNGAKALQHSKSAESVDDVRKRIAAVIKRK